MFYFSQKTIYFSIPSFHFKIRPIFLIKHAVNLNTGPAVCRSAIGAAEWSALHLAQQPTVPI
jgi:hypothetical protein